MLGGTTQPHLRFLIATVLLTIMASTDVQTKSISLGRLEIEWQKFKAKFERNYKDEAEEARRKQIFKETLAIIEAHNELYSKGLTTFTMGINQFADMDKDERKRWG